MIGSSNAVIKTGGGVSSIFNTVIDQDTQLSAGGWGDGSWWESDFINWDNPDIPTDFTVTENVQSLVGPFGQCRLKTINLSGGGENLSTMRQLLTSSLRSGGVESISFDVLDTSNVTNMQGMLQGGTSLTSVDLSSLNTSNVTRMSGMFGSCSSLTSIDLSSFDIGKVMDMGYMFQGCSSLTDVVMPSSAANAVTDIADMFASCSSLTSIDLSSFAPNNLTDMMRLFYQDSSLKYINLSGWTTTQSPNNGLAFGNCTALEALVIDSPSVFSLTNVSALTGSGIENGTGFVYVPDNLVDEYKSATNWSTVADQIKPLSELPQEVKDVFNME